MKRPFLLLLSTLLALLASAYDAQIDGIYYNFSGDEATVTYCTNYYSSYSGNVVIPESVTFNDKTYSVTSIGDYAFQGFSDLTSITIPNSVTSIGNNAFQGCSGLTSVTIGSSVTSIGHYAFRGCSGLTSIIIPNCVTNIGIYAFSGCSSLTSITIPNSVTSIGEGVFSGCSGLTSINIPNSVTSIGLEAFSGCSGLTSITIPNSVTSIGGYAFSGCSSLISVTIPNSVNSIGDYAFRGCSGLTSITIGSNVTSIGNNAFSGCSGLTSVIINCPYVGSWFSGLTSIQEVTLGETVTSIGSEAFRGCSGLTSITILNDVTGIGRDAFAGTAWYENLPDGVVYIGTIAYKYKGAIPQGAQISVTLKEGTTAIAGSAFYECSGLTSITIPNSVTSIDYQAFYGCGLTSITIPGSVTSIGSWAFWGCSNLTSVHITDLAAWCNIAFNDYYSNPLSHAHRLCLNGQEIKDLVIPNSVTSIGHYAFYKCRGLTSVTIPSSVTSIGSQAFAGCSDLTSIIIPNSVTSIGFSTFDGCSGLTSVTIPESVTDIGIYAFRDCSGLTSITIGNNVTSIGEYAFSRCSGLTSITIPGSVASIGRSAFENCSGLKSVSIGNGVNSIGGNAFNGCKLRNLLIQRVTPPAASSAFSEQTLYHTMLYIPVDSWDAYAYDNAWYKFINIRETATAGEQVSLQQAYMLMDAETFAYFVYDPVSDGIVSISSSSNIDGDNPNHSWLAEQIDGQMCLYNVGAGKFAVPTSDGSLTLSSAPAIIEVENGEGGILFDGKTEHQWAFVCNDRMNAEAIITGIKDSKDFKDFVDSWHSLDGRRLSAPQKGINIVRYSDGTTRKVLVK